MKYLTAILLFTIFTLTACNKDSDMDDATGTLDINYKLVYDGQPLVMNETLDYPNDLKINFSRVNFFLSNFRLNDTKVADLTFIDFTDINIDENSAEAGSILRINDIPTAQYNSFSMGVGLTEEMNSTQPADHESGNPLSLTSEYWEGWDSYIFAKYDGKVDLNGDGNLETGFSFHTGTDEVYRILTFDENITINANETTEVTVTLDAKELFRLDTSYIDLSEIQSIHDQGELDLMNAISDNYSAAFTLEN